MSIQIPPGDFPWAIRQTQCFDSTTHRFVRRDIEIAGARIRAVLPAGASSLAEGLDGERYLCTPGVVGMAAAGAAPPPFVTTMGWQCARLRDVPPARAGGPRAVALLKFDGRQLEEVNSLLEWSGASGGGRFDGGGAHPVKVLPVLASASLLSATELMEAAKFARAIGTRIGIALCADADEAREFRSRFYCSESALISYLLPQEPHVTVFGAARIDAREAQAFARTLCAVALGEPDAEHLGRRWRQHAPLFTQRRAALFAGANGINGTNGANGTNGTNGTNGRLAPNAGAEQPDYYADALTRHAAAALGLPDVGTLAPGMRADLCLFERDGADERGGSATFLSLLASRAPAATLVDGRRRHDEARASPVRAPVLAACA